MQTPATRLREPLEALAQAGIESVLLLNENYSPIERISIADALVRVIRGEIEGIGTTNRPVQKLRILRESERVAPDLLEESIPASARSRAGTINAQTNLGVFREEVYRERIEGGGLNGLVIVSREVVGRVWTHCAHRGGIPGKREAQECRK